MRQKILYVISLLHILFQIVYTTFGNLTSGTLGQFKHVFLVFCAEYFLLSGAVTLVVTYYMLKLIFSGTNRGKMDIFVLMLNIEYLMYHIKTMTTQ